MTHLRIRSLFLVLLALFSLLVFAVSIGIGEGDAPSLVNGKALFSKTNLGPAGKSCADCHPRPADFRWRPSPKATRTKVGACHRDRQGSKNALSAEALRDLTAFVMAGRTTRFEKLAGEGAALAGRKDLGTAEKSCLDCHPAMKEIGWLSPEEKLKAGIEMCRENCIVAEEPFSEEREERLLVWAISAQRKTRIRLEEAGAGLFKDKNLGTTSQSCADCHPSMKPLPSVPDLEKIRGGIRMCFEQCLKAEREPEPEEEDGLVALVLKRIREKNED
ncbi:MAG: hypothetical protein ACYS47_06540 [Planctomycetota bacterium]|jgi:cytochrome c553